MNKKTYPLTLLIILAVVWIVLAINPVDRADWLAENVLLLIFVPSLILTYKRFQFSSWSYTLIFFFLILQTIGSHYTYAQVPFILDSARNHYDRVVHFLFGIVFYFPLYELLTRKVPVKGWWAHFFTFSIIVSMKGIYEILEWLFVVVTESSTASIAFLGAQGDTWDAQKDMVLGTIGAILSGVFLSLKRR